MLIVLSYLLKITFNLLSYLTPFFRGKIKEFFEDRTFEPGYLSLKDSQSRIWFHVSSAGELEQAIPAIKRLLELNHQVLVTYLSPSAKPFLKKLPQSHENPIVSFALPIETPNFFTNFVLSARVSHVVFVRYDTWPNVILGCLKAKVPYSIISATELSSERFKVPPLSSVSRWVRHFAFRNAHLIFCINQNDVSYFETLTKSRKVIYSGDAKWARALDHIKSLKENLSATGVIKELYGFLSPYREAHIPIVAFGSPHKDEHEICIQLLKRSVNQLMVYAPHDISPSQVENLVREFSQLGIEVLRASQIGTHKYQREVSSTTSKPIVIVDVMGYLSQIYGLADVSVIGGGFDGQIHNVLETSAHGTPALFGPIHKRAPEAQKLLDAGAGIEFKNANDLLSFLLDFDSLKSSAPVNIKLDSVRIAALRLFANVTDSSKVITEFILQTKPLLPGEVEMVLPSC